MNELVNVLRASDLAAQWHVHQRRKGAAGEPYINHLLEVANLVTEATNGLETNVTIAALLHDAIEDQKVKAETIAKEFGQYVANIVLEVTDDKSLPKEERKRLQVEHAPHKSREAKLVKLADKISNIRAIADSPAPDWTAQRKLEYVQWRVTWWLGCAARRRPWSRSLTRSRRGRKALFNTLCSLEPEPEQSVVTEFTWM